MPQGYKRVQAKTTIPIAGGECSFMRWPALMIIVIRFLMIMMSNFKIWIPWSHSKPWRALCLHRPGVNDISVPNDCICSWSNYNHILSQPDIAASGGLSEFLKISAIASTFGVGWQGFVGIAMNTLTKMTTEEHNHIKLIALTTMTKLIPRWTLFRMFGAPQLVWRQVSMPWW